MNTTKPTRPKRALVVQRLSRMLYGSQTGIEVQDKAAEDYCGKEGWEIVHKAVDENISGGSNPWGMKKRRGKLEYERPELGPWVDDKNQPDNVARYDVIVAAKLDRLGRNARIMYHFRDWVEKNGKELHIIEPSSLYWPPKGPSDVAPRIVWPVLEALAEIELQIDSERIMKNKQEKRYAGMWLGGQRRSGYRPICTCHDKYPCPEKDRPIPARGGVKYPEGYVLTKDPKEAAILNEAADRILAGESASSVAADFTERPVPHEWSGRWTDQWSSPVLTTMLRSPVLMGYVVQYPKTGEGNKQVNVHKPQYVYDPESGLRIRYVDKYGDPIDPVMTEDKWSRLQAKLSENAEGKSFFPRKDTTLLTGIIKCPCGLKYYQDTNKQRGVDYYTTDSGRLDRKRACPHGDIRQDTVIELVDNWIYRHDFVLKERVPVGGGHDIEARMAQCLRDMDVLNKRLANDQISEEDFYKQHSALNTERRDLKEQLATAKPEYEWRPVKNPDGTPKALADAWREWGTARKRQFLIENEFDIEVYREVDEFGIIENRDEWIKSPLMVKPKALKCICGQPARNQLGMCAGSGNPKISTRDNVCRSEWEHRNYENKKARKAGKPAPWNYRRDKVWITIVPGWKYDASFWGMELESPEEYAMKIGETFEQRTALHRKVLVELVYRGLAKEILRRWGKTPEPKETDTYYGVDRSDAPGTAGSEK